MSAFLWYLRTVFKKALGRGVFKSYAQFGEDVVAAGLLRGVSKGVYVDVGAFDPVLYSNTYHFYKRGWRGLVIDPNPVLTGRYAIARPGDTFINCGVAESKGLLTYHEFNYPAYNTFNAKEASEYLYANSKLKVLNRRHLAVRPLAEILSKNKINHIDFLSVDAQGFDLQVLQSMGTMRPTVIAVEVQSGLTYLEGNPVYEYLTSIGYKLAGVTDITLLFKRS